MAGTLSNAAETAAIDHLLGTTDYTFVAQLYLALFTVNPDFETGAGGTEATGGSYVRKAINFDAAASPGGTSQSDPAIVWTVGTDIAAGTYTGWGVYDASTVGTMRFGDTFGAGKVLTSTGDTLTFADQAVTFSLT
jgi:hypothetical protein